MPKKLALLGFAALGLLCGAAKGAVDTHTATFSSILNSPELAFTLPKFNPALGSLQSVQFTLAGTAVGIYTFDNESAVAGNVALSYGFATTASTDTPSIISLTDPIFNASGNKDVTADNDGTPDFAGTDAFALSGNGSHAVSSPLLTAANYLSQFTLSDGVAHFAVRIDNTVTPIVGATTAGIFGATRESGGHLDGTVTVAYTYVLAPIPEAVSTLWGAAIGIFAIGRRRRVRQG